MINIFNVIVSVISFVMVLGVFIVIFNLFLTILPKIKLKNKCSSKGVEPIYKMEENSFYGDYYTIKRYDFTWLTMWEVGNYIMFIPFSGLFLFCGYKANPYEHGYFSKHTVLNGLDPKNTIREMYEFGYAIKMEKEFEMRNEEVMLNNKLIKLNDGHEN